MALQSVATQLSESPKPLGTEADLFLSCDGVLTVYVTKHSNASPPDEKTATKLHNMVCGLARASLAITNEIVRDEKNAELWADAADEVAYATMLLSQLAEAVTVELNAATREDAA